MDTFAAFTILILTFFGITFAIKYYLHKRQLRVLNELHQRALGQVVHDFKSPLAAIKLAISNLPSEARDQRVILESAAGRMDLILQDLRPQFTMAKKASPDQIDPSFTFIAPSIQSVAAEFQYLARRDFTGLQLTTFMAGDAEYAVAQLRGFPLEKALSKVLLNCLPCKGKFQKLQNPSINLTFKTNETEALINIDRSFTSSDDSDLKLKEILQELNSNNINSSFHPSHIKLTIPLVAPPEWLCKELSLEGVHNIYIIEDDYSVAQAWISKLRPWNNHFFIKHFSSPENEQLELELKRLSPKAMEKTLFIIDYEFLGTSVTGLDLILKKGLTHNAILCTSHFNNPSIQKALVLAGAKMLPKHMLASVTVVEGHRSLPDQNTEQSTIEVSNVVLIDDDDLIRYAWTWAASKQQRKIDAYAHHRDFLRRSSDYNFETLIFIDKNMGDVCGLEIAQQLYERGYKNLYLSTGEPMLSSDVPTFFKGVIADKMFPGHLLRF